VAAPVEGATTVTLGSSGCGSLGPGQNCTLSALVTGTAASGQVIWSTSPLSYSSNLATPFTTPSSPGSPQTNVFTAPSNVTAKATVTVVATASDGTASNAVTVTLVPNLSVTVSPSTVTLTEGQNQQFTATVTGTSNTAVTWSISPSVGTMYPTGYYIAPASVATSQKITVTATSAADTTKSGTATISLNAQVHIGDGAPTVALQAAFQQAYQRGAFSLATSLPPLGNVKALGSTGYVQEFPDANNTSGVKLALVTANMATAGSQPPVWQIYSPLYVYYSSTGTGTAGYPTGDSMACPPFDPVNSCVYGIFDKPAALFAYASALAGGQNFSITSTFYTEWAKLGGINGPGRPIAAQNTGLSAGIIAPATAGTQYTVQNFSAGAIYSITSGANKGLIFGVTEPVYDFYLAQGGPPSLGVPTTEAIQINSSGLYQQSFEGGTIQYTATSSPILLLPVKAVQISGVAAGSTTTLNVGQTVTLTATPVDASGSPLAGRYVSWVVTNSKVIGIQANGATAVVTAVGGGAASVQASSQGVASAKANFIVVAPCCQVGDGTPAAIQQAFQDALSRNHISVQTPVQAPASRAGNGYVQMVLTTAGAAVMIAQSDTLGTAYVVSGPLLTAYQTLGGPTGSLGYPTDDASAGGTQLFANSAALAGTPVRLVSGVILAKWALLGYETGTAGLPQSDASAFATPGVNSGVQQAFARGTIFGATAGPRAGQAYFVSGLILARYTQLGGPAGDLGMPIGDEYQNGALRQQNFENGNITYTPGDAAAAEHINPRTPAVIVAPSAVTAGGTVRLAVTGFANNVTLKVTVTGQPAFSVATSNGAYTWEMSIPLTAKSGTIAIHASDSAGSAAADGSLTVRGFADNRVPMTKIQGDGQTGLPGALLPLPLQVALVDSSGIPVAGAAVTFQAAPGAVLSNPSTVTDSQGHAQTYVRLPAAKGTTAVTVSAPNVAQAPVTFYMTAAAATLSGVQAWTMTGGNGALLTAVATILRYYQDQGTLAKPNGPVDPAALSSFLNADCTVDLQGAERCDGFVSSSATGEPIVNLWRAGDFTGGVDVAAHAPSTAAIADLLAHGSPVLVSLELARNGAAAGGQFVVATGVGSDGSIAIQDPNPYFARTSLSDYLAGFTAGGSTWTGTLAGVVQFALRTPPATRFLVGALSQPPALMQSLTLAVQSPEGACGVPVELMDSVDGSGRSPGGGVLISRFLACDGAQTVYQIAAGASQPYRAFVTDLASAGSSFDVSGNSLATYQATRRQLNLVLSPQTASITAGSVVNAATFTGGIAPGGIVSIFGAGLSGPGVTTAVDVDGVAADVLLPTPFQINAVLPVGTSAGSHVLRVKSAFGSAQQTVMVSPVAPAIFQMGSPSVGAVTNQDNSLNTPQNPVLRGQSLVIYCTGLGATASQGLAVTPVTVMLNGQELPASYAGQTPGVPGLYQVNVVVPAGTAPGLTVPITLKQGGQLSNTVNVSLE
jgi:uncharacterized protein (TIGR03437 family)